MVPELTAILKVLVPALEPKTVNLKFNVSELKLGTLYV